MEFPLIPFSDVLTTPHSLQPPPKTPGPAGPSPREVEDTLGLVGFHLPKHRNVILTKPLGQGGFGTVYLATRKRSNGTRDKVAVKVIQKTDCPRRESLIVREIHIHRALSSDEGIPTLHYVDQDEKAVYLTMVS